jgi:pyruvate dehydrogenase E2 component (dihydrolipoamide acetyltransferase)
VIGYITTTVDEPLEIAGERGGKGAGEQRGRGAEEKKEAPREVREKAVVAEEGAGKKHIASPRARRVAEEKGVDLSQVVASSPSGRIVEADVLKFLAQVPPSPPQPSPPAPLPPVGEGGEEIIPLIGIRKLIAERMSESAHTTARVTLTTEADATRLAEMRAAINERRTDVKISFTDLFVKIVAAALKQHPQLNSTLATNEIRVHANINMGIAVDTERGLMVPVIRDADRKALAEISRELRDLSERARTSKILPDELRGGTFTITNLGPAEIDAFTPIINPGETAILGIGRIVLKPAAYQGQIALRQMVALSLSFDHRVVDGAPAARFLQTIKAFVEEPGLLMV